MTVKHRFVLGIYFYLHTQLLQTHTENIQTPPLPFDLSALEHLLQDTGPVNVQSKYVVMGGWGSGVGFWVKENHNFWYIVG